MSLVHYGINKAPVLATPFKGVAPLTERLSVFPITKKTGALFPPTSTSWEKQGANKALQKVALNSLREGLSVETVVKITGPMVERVQELKAE